MQNMKYDKIQNFLTIFHFYANIAAGFTSLISGYLINHLLGLGNSGTLFSISLGVISALEAYSMLIQSDLLLTISQTAYLFGLDKLFSFEIASEFWLAKKLF